MVLHSGTRLGPYEILSPLGAGGMGEVYKARDSRLGREVAVKVLPPEFAADRDRLRRFEQEARAAAALNHPNILVLYDIGSHNDVSYLVTELLEGESLRQKLRAGALPPAKAAEFGIQIARGLAAAHEKDIVHRDLKPENLFVTKDGRIKILDFGLARLRPGDPLQEEGRSQVPTADLPTREGTVLGTVGYMAPEQVRGQPVDCRADLFSFGVVLYEMLSGKAPFTRDSAADTLSAILNESPPPPSSADVPCTPALVRLLDHCLEKAPESRFQSARDLVYSLENLAQTSGAGESLAGAAGTLDPKGQGRWPLRWILAGAACGAVAAAVLFLAWTHLLGGNGRAESGAEKAPPIKFQRLTSFDGVETWPTISPDGKTVAYQKRVGGKTDVYLLRVGGQNPINLTGAVGGDCGEPAFSPDGSLIAFRSDSNGGGVFLMGATGESVRRLTDFGHTPSWFPDGKRLVIATEAKADPTAIDSDSQLWIVEVATGSWTKLALPLACLAPAASPHGTRIAFWGVRAGAGGQRDIYTVSAGEGDAPSVSQVTNDQALDWTPFWSGDGRFLYFASDRNGTMNLWRVGIDEATGRVRGEPEPVTVPVSWAGPFRTTPDGTRIVFSSLEEEKALERLPFDARTESVTGPATEVARFVARVLAPRVSPDGSLVTFSTYGSKEDIAVMKADGSGLRKLTDDHFHNRLPDFSPDGTKIVFFSDRAGAYDLWVIDVDGSGLRALTKSTSGNVKIPVWSPDGKAIAAEDEKGRPFVLSYPRSPEDPLPKPGPLPGEHQQFWPYSWSPDSRSVAGFCAWDDGSYDGILIYDVQTSTYRRLTETGWCPVFLKDGRRIVFQDGNSLRVMDLSSGRSRSLLQGDPRRRLDSFGIAPDESGLFAFTSVTQADLWLMDLSGGE